MNLLVPVSASRSNEATVAYAVEQLREEVGTGTIYLVYSATAARERIRDEFVEGILSRSAEIARERADDTITVTTTTIGRDRYLADPHDHATMLAAYAHEIDIDWVVLDPNYSVDATDPTLQPFEQAFERAGLSCEHAIVNTPALPGIPEIIRFGTIFVLAFGFSLVVAGSLDAFAVLTGLIGAMIAAVLFRNVAFEITPRGDSMLFVFVRGILFAPYFLGKILIANFQISYLVLHPSLPIDPHLDRVETGLPDGLSITGLANSLTLTPGTLTVDAVGDTLFVHSITEPTRLEVLRGDRLRGVRFVFYGRHTTDQRGVIDPERSETIAGPRHIDDLTEDRDHD